MSVVIQRTQGTYFYMQNANDKKPLYVIRDYCGRFKIEPAIYDGMQYVPSNPFANFSCASVELAKQLIDDYYKAKNKYKEFLYLSETQQKIEIG